MTAVTMGRLASQKGHWHLIRAFRKITDHMPEMELAILGEGPLEEYLKKLVSDLNLEDQIKFLGFQSNPYPHLANSTMFILPSLYEGFPNVLIEAMACGIPVLASDCYTGPREILAPETDYLHQTGNIEYAKYGVLIPVCDGKKYSAADDLTREENILADAVINLCNDPAKLDSYSKKAMERVSDFHPTKIGKQWIELIEKVSSAS
jgi:glycosyltransferase involved in cell wall biosynthesis